MMQHADNEHSVSLDTIEYPVSSIHQTAIAPAIFGCGGPRQRMLSKHGKSLPKPAEIPIGDIVPECCGAIFVYRGKISVCRRIGHDPPIGDMAQPVAPGADQSPAGRAQPGIKAEDEVQPSRSITSSGTS